MMLRQRAAGRRHSSRWLPAAFVAQLLIVTGIETSYAQDDPEWVTGAEAGTCFAATIRPGIGITYSARDKLQMFLAGSIGAIRVPEANAFMEIGKVSASMHLKPVDDIGNWIFEPKNDPQAVRKVVNEILKGTAGPLKISSFDGGFDMEVETAELKGQGDAFHECVKRATPGI